MDYLSSLKAVLFASVLGCAAVATPVLAQQTATTTFDVTITITSVCTVNAPAATNVVFGTQPSNLTNVDAAGQLNVNCTLNTPYNIALNQGTFGADINTREMAGLTVTTDRVPYQLYRNATRGAADVWGQTIGTDTYSGTGTGAVQAIPVYGRVASTSFPAQSYSDTVTATITY